MTNPGRRLPSLPGKSFLPVAGNLAGAQASATFPLLLGTIPDGVLVRKLDTGRSVCALDHDTAAPLRIAGLALETHDGVFTDFGALADVLNGPFQHRASGAALRWRDHYYFLPSPNLVALTPKVAVPFSCENGDIIFIDGDKRTTQKSHKPEYGSNIPTKQSFSGLIAMEKNNRISNHNATSFVRQIEAMRESAVTIDGILTGVYSALASRNDIAPEILQLLALGAARAEVLALDMADLKKPTLVKAH